MYEAYELYLSAGLYDAAHDIAVLELAPDAVIRDDLALLRELFDVFDGRPVNGWSERGKVLSPARSMVMDSVLIPSALPRYSWTTPKP